MDNELKQEVVADLRKKIAFPVEMADQQILDEIDGTFVLEITVLDVALRRFFKEVLKAVGLGWLLDAKGG